MTVPTAFSEAFFALPAGTFTGRFGGRSYVVSRTVSANGRAHKLVANERGGPDYISLNLYRLSDGQLLLRPCEMPADKVIRFTTGLTPDTQ
ncbi:MAG: hypothetical protein AB3N21_13340 [Ruegeria sp.]|uniref:hypothetical protein n=1 Tax=Ruegeria sp. TaxID=1879320 RepID=UPI00349E87AE